MSEYETEREFTRVTTRFNIEVTTAEKTIRSGETRDLSMKSVFVVCEEEMSEGTECSVSIRLGEPESGLKISARGTVIRRESASPGFALQFTEVDVDSYEHLRQMVLLNAQDPQRIEEEFNGHLGLKPHKDSP